MSAKLLRTRAGALALLIMALVMLAVLGLVVPASVIVQHRDTLAEIAREETRLFALKAAEADMRRERDALRSRIAADAGLVAGASRVAAQDRLLARLRDSLTRHEGTLTSFVLAEPEHAGRLERLAVTLQFSIPEAGLARFLAEIAPEAETSNLVVVPARGTVAGSRVPLEVQGEFFVFYDGVGSR